MQVSSPRIYNPKCILKEVEQTAVVDVLVSMVEEPDRDQSLTPNREAFGLGSCLCPASGDVLVDADDDVDWNLLDY